MIGGGVANGGILEQVERFWCGISKGERSYREGGLVYVVLGNARIGDVDSEAIFSCLAKSNFIPPSRDWKSGDEGLTGTGQGSM